MPEAGFSHIFQTLKHRDFRIFITGQTLSQTGVWMQRVIVGWYTWELTHSATWLGLISLADLFPALFIGSLFGAVADRVDRLTIIRLTQIGCAATATALCLMVVYGWSSIELLFFLTVTFSTCVSMNLPARLAIVPNLVGKDNLHSAVAINSVVSNAGRFLGPAIAGMSIVQWGVGPAFAICAACFGVPACTLMLINPPADESKPTGKRILTDVADGLVYTFRHPGIGPLMASLIVTSILGKAIIVMFPAFSSVIFERGADGVAWLTGITGAGAILGGLFIARRGGVKGLTRIFILNIALIGVSLTAFAATGNFWIAIGIATILGASQMINGVSAQTLIQNAVDGQMRGRVASLYVIIQRGGQSLGGFILGVAADLVGLRWSVICAGIVCLGFWLWSLRRKNSMASILER